jgi:hypothetical protein
MKDEKLLYLRRAKMKLDVYNTHLEGSKEWGNSLYMIEKIIMRYIYMHLPLNYKLLSFSILSVICEVTAGRDWPDNDKNGVNS